MGFPCRNSDVLILNDEKKECAINEEGELCVRGSSLALGYYNNSERTASAFIQNPLNSAYPEIIYCTGDIVYKNEQGEIMYVGRKDFQIKHSGYRIELGEIENAVLGTHMVDSCCVVYDFKNKQIVLFYQSHEDLNLGEFRKSILKFIPRYMMPTVNNRVESMEINANGKIDRKYYTALLNG
ncbi:AMP-binding protein [Phocaeicola vulgatus]|uniref:AMP-binding protein n=1 Tax=Phocaeicola vulgatus TaxID=821 RepID=UPI001C386226|nr:AMP-binding protein [Phocaeicola vulgatus]MBV4062779.1 AMP-binding protein [Phocaeicola vulgatus]MBV4113278.1 AMP-binding protein [Phocaeicola vulgatus]MDC1568465.1 AMP-binding protein [Phocaeicola vulgatus]